MSQEGFEGIDAESSHFAPKDAETAPRMQVRQRRTTETAPDEPSDGPEDLLEPIRGRLSEAMAREGIGSLEELTMLGCALLFEEVHGVPITPESLQYRMRAHGLDRFEAICLPKSSRGKRSSLLADDRRRGRSGRRRKISKFAPPCPYGYVYSHVDYREKRGSKVRFIGYGRGSAFCDTSGMLCEHEPAHIEWLGRWIEGTGRLLTGLNLTALENPDWLGQSGAFSGASAGPLQVVLVSKPMANPESVARLLYLNMHRAGFELFRDTSYKPC